MTGIDVDVLVIGAGLTGLGASKRLQQLVCCSIAAFFGLDEVTS